MTRQPELRTAQSELRRRIKFLIQESSGGPLKAKKILCDIACGGGKSTMPSIAFNELKQADIVDKVCIVCPRENLATQVAEEFLNPFFRKLIGHSYQINEATNDIDPCRGTDGYATTYQALGADRTGINLFEFKRSRYLLVLDECQHVAKDSKWASKIMPLMQTSKFVLLMSGTLERHDGQRIAFLPYKEVRNGI